MGQYDKPQTAPKGPETQNAQPQVPQPPRADPAPTPLITDYASL